jgi:hypothetical protein
MKLINS